MRFSRSIIWIIIILVVASYVRLVALNTVPSGFHQDEVANAYVGRYILQNGQDPTGTPWPLLYFDKHGDFPPVLPMYLAGLGTYLLGFTPAGARIIPALFGIIGVGLLYILTYQLTRKRTVSLIAMAALALAPWHIHFSRIGTEGTIALTVWLAGLITLVHAAETKGMRWYILTAVLLSLTYVLYPGYRLTAPLSVLVIWYAYRHRPGARRILAIAGILIFTTGIISSTAWGRGRLNQTGIFSQAKETQTVLYSRDAHIKRARVTNNIAVVASQRLISNAYEYLSPAFVFGDRGQPPWFQIPQTAPLYTAYAICICVGIYTMLRKKNKQEMRVLLILGGLSLAALTPALLTVEHTPHLHRALPLVVPLCMLVAVGATRMENRLLQYGLLCFWIGEVALFGYHYNVQLNGASAVARSDANWRLVQMLSATEQPRTQTVLFASGWMPAYYLYQRAEFDPTIGRRLQKNFRTDRIDKTTFVDADCPTPALLPKLRSISAQSRIVLTSSCKNLPAWLVQYDTVQDAAGNAVYKLYHVIPDGKR